VIISRGNPRGRRFGDKGKPLSSIFKFRNLFLILLVFQCLRMLTRNEEVSLPPSSGVADEGRPSDPVGIKGQLGGFKDVNARPVGGGKQPQAIENDDDEDDDGKKILTSKDEEKNLEDESTEDLRNGEEDETTDVLDEKDAIEQSDNRARQETDSSADLNPIVIDKKGTGPTNVGYVKDFVHERANPAYKIMDTPVTDPSPTVAKLINEKSVLPCHDETAGSMNPRCSDQDTPLIAYNSESFHRTWCGQEIKSKSAVVMTEHCTNPVAHLFSAEVPPITGEHMPPIIIKSSANKEVQDGDLEKIECNIPCLQEKGLTFGGVKNSNNDYFIDGETWKITSSMESSESKMDRTDCMNNHYYSTQSLLSSIPLSTFDSKIHSLRNRPALDFETAVEKAIYLVNDNCSAHSTKRNRWFGAVEQKITVDSFGVCGHNIEVPQGMTIATPEGRIALSKQYRIVLAFDKASTKDHISDVVWEAFVSGAVPVVVGADNLRERFPPNSFINVNDFNKWDELGDYVKKVISDKELWMSYQEWRDDEEAVSAFERQYYFTRTDSTCRLCRWAYAKKYGLGWDHTKQEVRSIPKVPKEKFCTTADHGLVSKPFSEKWVTKSSGEDDEKVLEEDSEGESCSSLGTDGSIVIGAFSGHRKIVQHDGITDIIITNSVDEIADGETTLRLTFPGVRNPEGACFYNTHSLISTAKGSKVSSASIQDDLVKITMLANWDTTVKSSGEGIMEVAIKNDKKSKSGDGSIPRRVRVIIEEMNIVTDKMTEFFPSTYCKLMTKDFIDPIGVYFVDS